MWFKEGIVKVLKNYINEEGGDFLIEGYSEYVIDALLNLDYDIAELNGVSNYFTDLINKKWHLDHFLKDQ